MENSARKEAEAYLNYHTGLIESGDLALSLSAYIKKIYHDHHLEGPVREKLESMGKSVEKIPDLFHIEKGQQLILSCAPKDVRITAAYLKGTAHRQAVFQGYLDIFLRKYPDELSNDSIRYAVVKGMAEYISTHGVNYKPSDSTPALTLQNGDFEEYFSSYERNFRYFLRQYLKKSHMAENIYRRLPYVKEIEAIASFRTKGEKHQSYEKWFLSEYQRSRAYSHLLDRICGEIDREGFLGILEKTRRYRQAARDYHYILVTLSSVRENIVTAIPDELKDLYPAARRLRRHFVLHTGPTNSGKTYEALQALKESMNGCYLAPLRMLALEKYDELNRADCPCSLKTGEEEKLIEGAPFQAATVEMADFGRVWQCVVIDECQMITDEFRGGSWTAAILGLQALELHLCMSPWAKDMILKLITSCGDSYEIVEHKRTTLLIAEDEPLKGLRYVRDHDALIAFSRKSVHAIASALEKHGVPTSIIYGSLPYDVRQNEAEKFRLGHTKVVVATDAIGMGMNLPIERVVFTEMTKFDGKIRRDLNMEEIRQIAGRAGRRGLYETGYVTTTSEEGNALVAGSLETYLTDIPRPMMDFPPSLLGIEGKVSDIMKGWDNLPPIEGFGKENIAETIFLAEEAEKLTDDKMTVYRLASVALDSTDPDQMGDWYHLAELTVKGELTSVKIPWLMPGAPLRDLEEMHKIYDVYFQFGRIFEYDLLKEQAAEMKERTSGLIISYLEKNGKEGRVCRNCGRPLPWDSKRAICDRCYAFGSGRRW